MVLRAQFNNYQAQEETGLIHSLVLSYWQEGEEPEKGINRTNSLAEAVEYCKGMYYTQYTVPTASQKQSITAKVCMYAYYTQCTIYIYIGYTIPTPTLRNRPINDNGTVSLALPVTVPTPSPHTTQATTTTRITSTPTSIART
jgi:hypothetical protein